MIFIYNIFFTENGLSSTHYIVINSLDLVKSSHFSSIFVFFSLRTLNTTFLWVSLHLQCLRRSHAGAVCGFRRPLFTALSEHHHVVTGSVHLLWTWTMTNSLSVLFPNLQRKVSKMTHYYRTICSFFLLRKRTHELMSSCQTIGLVWT